MCQNVALRKESVDRNSLLCGRLSMLTRSLSARRAWIEILSAVLTELLILVALRKESVDRNNISANNHVRVRKVALRKESVDRNFHVRTVA